MNSFRIAFSKVKFVQNYDCVKNKLANLRVEHNDYTKKSWIDSYHPLPNLLAKRKRYSIFKIAYP